MAIRLKTPAASEIMTPAQARIELIIASDDDGITDDEITEKIKDARGEIEDMSGHTLMEEVYEMFCDDWPSDDIIRIRMYPVKETGITVEYKALGDADYTVFPNDTTVDNSGFPARIYLKGEIPTLAEDEINRIRVTFTAGYSAVNMIPRGLLRAYKLFLTDAFSDRQDKRYALSRAEQICIRHRQSIF